MLQWFSNGSIRFETFVLVTIVIVTTMSVFFLDSVAFSRRYIHNRGQKDEKYEHSNLKVEITLSHILGDYPGSSNYINV